MKLKAILLILISMNFVLNAQANDQASDFFSLFNKNEKDEKFDFHRYTDIMYCQYKKFSVCSIALSIRNQNDFKIALKNKKDQKQVLAVKNAIKNEEKKMCYYWKNLSDEDRKFAEYIGSFAFKNKKGQKVDFREIKHYFVFKDKSGNFFDLYWNRIDETEAKKRLESGYTYYFEPMLTKQKALKICTDPEILNFKQSPDDEQKVLIIYDSTLNR